jgi:glutamine amidotransferase PdxT
LQIPTWLEAGTIAVVNVHARCSGVVLGASWREQAAEFVKQLHLNTLRVEVRRNLDMQ